MRSVFFPTIIKIAVIAIMLSAITACSGGVRPFSLFTGQGTDVEAVSVSEDVSREDTPRSEQVEEIADPAAGHAAPGGSNPDIAVLNDAGSPVSQVIPGPETYTLEQSIERALTVNPRILAVRSDVHGAAAGINQNRGAFLPTLSARAGYTMINSIDAKGRENPDYMDQDVGTVNVRLSQPIFAGMTIFNSYQKAVLNKARIELWQKQVENELVLEVQLFFLELLRAREDVKSLRDAVYRLESNVTAASAFHERRLAPYSQVLQAHVDLADARQQLSQAENMVDTLQVRLNILLDYSAHRNIEYVGDLEKGAEFSKTFESCITRAFARRPEMQIAQKSIDMAAKDRKIALGRFSPQVDVSVDYHIRDVDYDEMGRDMFGPVDRDQRNTYWSAGVMLSWELGLGGQQYYRVRQASHEIDRLQHDRHHTGNQVTAEVRTYYMSLQEANERIETTRAALEFAREGYSMAANRMEVRMGTISELLDAQARLSRAEANYNKAIGDYLSSLARLYHAMGRVSHSLYHEEEPSVAN